MWHRRPGAEALGTDEGTSTQPVVMWIYEEAFVQYHLGYATAGAVALVVVIGIISAAQFYLLRDGGDRAARRPRGRRPRGVL